MHTFFVTPPACVRGLFSVCWMSSALESVSWSEDIELRWSDFPSIKALPSVPSSRMRASWRITAAVTVKRAYDGRAFEHRTAVRAAPSPQPCTIPRQGGAATASYCRGSWQRHQDVLTHNDRLVIMNHGKHWVWRCRGCRAARPRCCADAPSSPPPFEAAGRSGV